jgi:hypothetical protein
VLRGFFHAAVARVYFAKSECPQLATEVGVATDELNLVVVRFYPAILQPFLDAAEVLEGRSAFLRGQPAFLPLLDGFLDYFPLAAWFVVTSLFPV